MFEFVLTGIACISAFVLTLQRAHLHTSSEVDPVPFRLDTKRDLLSPVPDESNRLTRLTTGTAVVTLVIALQAYRIEDPKDVASIFAQLINWLYALVLVLASRNYHFPNDWGWVLNVHLFIMFAAAWCVSVYKFFDMFVSNPTKSWPDVLPSLLMFAIITDLVYLTSTVPEGPTFLDENGKRVIAIDTTSIASYLYFSWMSPLIEIAYCKGKLADKDLPVLPAMCRGHNLFQLFEFTKGKNLIRRIYLVNKRDIALQIPLAMISGVMFYAPAFFTNKFLVLLQDMNDEHRDVAIREAFIAIIYLAVSVFVLGLLLVHLWHLSSTTTQLRVKSLVNIEIYQKALCCRDLSVASKQDDINSSVGKIVNLMSTDVGRIANFFLQWFSIITAPTELIVGCCFLYSLLGKSCLLGFAIMILILPITHYNVKMFNKTQDKLMEARDKRISLMNEVLQGIRQIKFFAWEKNWEKRIMDARDVEIHQLAKTYIFQLLFQVVWQASPILVTLVSFWSFTKIEGHELTAPIAFTSITVFGELKFALNNLPEMLVQLLQARVSLKRVQTYLDQDEIDQQQSNNSSSFINGIGFKDATIGWNTRCYKDNDDDSGDSGFILKDLNIKFPKNKLSLICGATGSGKTLLMLSLLNEAVVISGEVYCPHQETSFDAATDIDSRDWILPYAVAYVAQNTWLQNASIRENILFGLPFFESRYYETIYVCALNKDLEIFQDGDQTEIGEKGITLSGGQKARVSLARAVYSRAQTILMDDVLSAVDAHTAKHLYENCLLGPLMKERTRILITHHVSLCLNGSDYIVHIENGRANLVGALDELRQSGQLALIFKENVEWTQEETVEKVTAAGEETIKKPRELVQEETRASGSVKARLYKTYFNAVGNSIFWIILLLIVLGTRTLQITETWWIKEWSSHSTDKQQKENSLDFYLGVYCLITISSIFIGTARHAFLYWGALGANKQLHAKLLHQIFRAPLLFFDTTPIGRILNRFSSDLETIDSQIPNDVLGFAIQWISIAFSVIAVSGVLPVFLVPLILIIVSNIRKSVMLVVTARELKRMESTTRSPLFSHFTETIVGVTTIRAFGASRQFLQRMLDYMDTNSRPFYYSRAVSRWITIRLSLSGAYINFLTGSIILMNLDKMDVSLAGFCISFLSSFTMEIYMGIKKYRDLEISFNSIERVVEFMEIKQEASESNNFKAPAQWPNKGEIEVKDLIIKYADDLEPVIRGISFSVSSQEKLGIVGRTGSGKSTLALSFFRFLEASDGSIIIDGVDIRYFDLEYLRSNLTIIPQDPTLFSGTLRSNLDPFDAFTDQEIRESLRRVHMDEFLDLNTSVTEGGKNFSQGQRQLLCLARALLKRSRIVFMDEATASVDFETDRAIQKTLATEFSDCTILCIAHRLHTVIEYDRILVMDQGKVLEIGEPLSLLQDSSSTFYEMCCKSGEYDTLYASARAKFDMK